MDENYLDNLLGQVSSDKKVNSGKKSSILDDDMDIDLSDLGDISLDELDGLDDIDLSGLDLDDIDFDDIDVLNLDSNKVKKQATSAKQAEEDFNLDSLVNDLEKEENEAKQSKNLSSSSDDVFAEADDILNQDLDVNEMFKDMGVEPSEETQGMNAFEETGSAEQPAYNDDATVNTLEEESFNIDDLFGTNDLETNDIGMTNMDNEDMGQNESEMSSQDALQMNSPSSDNQADAQTPEDFENMDLDDLFSALGIEDDSASDGAEGNQEEDFSAYTAGQGDLDDLFQASMELSMESGELDDIADISEVKGDTKKKKSKKPKKKKKVKNDESDEMAEDVGLTDIGFEKKGKRTLSEILFGEPDQDDIEEEKYLEEKKAQKEIDKEKKKAEKEEKKAIKKEQLELKKVDANKKAKEKEDKKKAKLAEYEAELEAEKDEKKVSNATVIVVFAFFAILAALVILGTKEFNYSQVIKKATDYFERQRYRLAYDEVSGVEVKEKDEELRDRIYTVMYVERLYESFENNMDLKRPDKALDALLRGIEKYDEHYEEAVELDIVEDILSCRAKIMFALADTYGIDEEQAYAIMALEGQEYIDTLNEYAKKVSATE